jgi:hypothetical protein
VDDLLSIRPWLFWYNKEVDTSKDYSTQTMTDPKLKVLLMAIRQALLIALGALEEYIGLERSVIPKHKK